MNKRQVMNKRQAACYVIGVSQIVLGTVAVAASALAMFDTFLFIRGSRKPARHKLCVS